MLALYLSATSLTLVTHKFYFNMEQKLKDERVQLVRNVLSWFDNMKNPVPTKC
ncbi:MAG: hypothetical protein FWD71_19085 [Oscillospiraceae bacterium]|nr:hypothetical protein [Oscillospiraceae bacterium]